MIKKERLEELIEQGATIYSEQYRELINLLETKNWDFFKGGFAECEYKTHRYLIVNLERLFETKEDGEEYAEFSNITRTERLELPTWASIEKDFDKFTNGSYVLAERDEFSLELKISKPLISQIIIYTEDDDYNWNLSRENYNKARRLCVKLFKGEE